jgi:peptide/nickel transport system substrate-binding protein
VGLVVASFLLVGPSAGASTKAAAGPQNGGTFTILKATEQGNGWDPIKFLGIPTNGETPQQMAIYDALFYADYITGKLVPRLGLSLTSSDNGTNWTLKLRPDVKFSDGTPFDADAVMFNWQRIADPANKASTATAVNVIKTMTVADPLTLKVTLNAPNPVWDQVVANRVAWIGSPTAIKSEGAAFASKPVGAGPFTLQSWVRDSSYTLVKNPNYWQKGRPYLDQIQVKIITDESANYNTFKSGGGDLSYIFDPATVAMANTDQVKQNQMAMTGGGFALSMNNSVAPFNDVRVRKAFDMAIDRNQFNQLRRNADKNVLMTTIQAKSSPYYDPKNTVPKYDLAGAQKLIDDYVASANGGKPLDVTLLVFNTPYIIQDYQVFQQQLQKLKNVNITLDIENSANVISKYVAGQYQAYMGIPRWNEPAVDFVNYFKTGSSINYFRYSNPQVDALLTQLQTATDLKTKKQLVSQATALILKDSPVAWYSRFPTTTLIGPKVRGIKFQFDQIPNIDSLWVTSKS